jgi:DNA-directed RNA polymerase subunit RPC12/RpoP
MSDNVWIKTHRDGKCAECGTELKAGDRALYEIGSHLNQGRKIYCEDCGKEIKNAS